MVASLWNSNRVRLTSKTLAEPVAHRIEVFDSATQPQGSELQQDATQQLQDFCHRWRLQQLVAPGLPLPQSRQMLQGHLLSATLQAEGSGFGVVIIPDTMPIPRESELRSLMHDTIRATDTAHLTDWLRIITPANPAKKELVRYARIFEVQHYYRCLMSRHAAACQRQKFLIMPVLAEYFGVSDDTIGKDLSHIRPAASAVLSGHFRFRSTFCCRPARNEHT